MALFHRASEIMAEYWLTSSIGMRFGSNLAENLEENVKRVFPVTPCLVLIINTPLPPLVPQMAVAAASFKTSMDSMSCGDMLSNAPRSSLLIVEKSVSSLILANCPCKASSMVVIGAMSTKSLICTFWVAEVCSLAVIPNSLRSIRFPSMTTWSIVLVSSCKVTFNFSCPVYLILFVFIPI